MQAFCENELQCNPLDERSIQSHLKAIICRQDKSSLKDLLQLDYSTHHFNKYNEYIFELHFCEISDEMKANYPDICTQLQNNSVENFAITLVAKPFPVV